MYTNNIMKQIYPPPQFFPPIILHIRKLYTNTYQIGKKLPKSDKLGIHSVIERKILNIFQNAVEASFTEKNKKLLILEKMRIDIELVKQLIRIENEIHILNEGSYINIETALQEISKETNGWINFIKTQNPLL